MGMKREIVLLESEKSLEDLYHTADVRLIDIHCFKGLPKKAPSLMRARDSEMLCSMFSSIQVIMAESDCDYEA